MAKRHVNIEGPSGGTKEYNVSTPMKAIRAKCIDCSGGSVYEPEKCTVESCPLWHYRFGKRPKE